MTEKTAAVLRQPLIKNNTELCFSPTHKCNLFFCIRRKTATVILSHCGCKRFCISAFERVAFYCAKKRSKIEPPELLPEEVTSLSFEVEKVSSMRVPFGAFEPGSTDIETTTPSV